MTLLCNRNFKERGKIIMYSIANILAAGSGWSVTNFLNNLNSSLQTWAAVGVSVLGIIMVIVALVKFGKGMMSDRAQTNWILVITMFLIGAALAFGGGWAFVQTTADFGTNTLNEIGTGSGGTP